ncbi:hypothetical protein CEE39_05400 [bacterium (candidate division B38) B3_B38]|nr:MAG: hypothetical protein CEE39_05400 [bacterium (candidate division B38) B3_B38]
MKEEVNIIKTIERRFKHCSPVMVEEGIRMRRNLFGITIVAVLAILFTACGGKEGEEPPPETRQGKVTIRAKVATQPLANYTFELYTYDFVDRIDKVAYEVKTEMKYGELEERSRQQINYHPQEQELSAKIDKLITDYEKETKRIETELPQNRQQEAQLNQSARNAYQSYLNKAYPNRSERAKKARQLSRANTWFEVYLIYNPELQEAKKASDSTKLSLLDGLRKQLDDIKKRLDVVQRKISRDLKLRETLRPTLERKLKPLQAKLDKLNEQVTKILEKETAEISTIIVQRVKEFYGTSEREPFTTDNFGIAQLKLTYGEYWVVGMVHWGDRNLVWNLPIEVVKREMEFEINDQNVAYIRKKDLFNYVVAALESAKPLQASYQEPGK